MDIPPFGLERWFAKYEADADIMLAESGIRSLPAARFNLDPGPMGYVIPTNGDPTLRATIGERYNREASDILCTCGTQEANFLAFLAVLGTADHAVVITPTYQALTAVPDALSNVTRIRLEPPDWRLDPDTVAEAIRPGTELIVLNNPNNPTGRYHAAETVEACYDLAEDAGAYLLCDEVYRLLADEPLPPVARRARGLSTSSLTKAYGLAGARFGWLAGPADVIESAWRWKDYTTISPSIIGQHIARQVLADEDAILEENRRLARRNRDRVAAFVHENDLEWHTPVSVTGFVTIPDSFDTAREFCRRFVEEDSVVLAPGDVFGWDRYVRIGFGLPTPELDEGLARLQSFITRHT